MSCVLLVAATTGYQLDAFVGAARQLGVELLLATDRCHVLDDPWNDHAVPVRFEDEAASVRAIAAAAAGRVDGVLALGDRPAGLAAAAAATLGLPMSAPAAVRAAGDKLQTRRRMQAAGLACPAFAPVGRGDSLAAIVDRVGFPCVVKPLALSASRGVVRADTLAEFEAAVARVQRLLAQPELAPAVDAHGPALLTEHYVPGREVAVEGLMTRGRLQVLATFDKPDPLEGPFFEETIYVCPSVLPPAERRAIAGAVARTASALGLTQGPIHAECRSNDDGVFVLEIAARPIGGLCARALRFRSHVRGWAPLEEVLLRHALGEPVTDYRRERAAAGVMMIPVPQAGRFRGVEGVDAARAVRGVEDVVITAKPGQQLQPLPEGGSYPGFIFARSRTPQAATAALRAAHARLRFSVAPVVPVRGAAAAGS